MILKKVLDIINNTIKDICKSDLPFANKTIILGGDFRQTLPIQKIGGNEYFTVQNIIKKSDLWNLFTVLKLTKNLRNIDEKFSNLLLKIGDGDITKFKIPDGWKTNDICKKIYGNINKDTINICKKSVILACHNEDVYRLNNKIIQFLDGESKTYYSIDYANHKGIDQSDTDLHLDYPIEVLNNIKEGLPEHELTL